MSLTADLFCYSFKDQDGVRIVPFLEYMQKYNPEPTDSQQDFKKKVKHIQNIKSHLRLLLEKQGSYYVPPYIEKYKDRELGILKMRLGNNLVRVAFYTHVTEDFRKIVLLNVFEKPTLYEKSKKRKVDKEIQKALDDAESCRDNDLKTGNAEMLLLNWFN